MSKNENNEEILNEEVAEDVVAEKAAAEDAIPEEGVQNSETLETDESAIDEGSDNKEEDAVEVESGKTEIFDESKALAEALVKAEAGLKESQDRYARTMAEFDNFRKRTLREKSEMHERGAKEILEKLLPIVDNFERAIDHISDEEKDLAITKGVEMIYKQLMGTLAEVGVEEIEALNQEFDPNLHHAVSHEDNDDYDDNMVQDVFQKGYMYKDTVLRHSMVKVVN